MLLSLKQVRIVTQTGLGHFLETRRGQIAVMPDPAVDNIPFQHIDNDGLEIKLVLAGMPTDIFPDLFEQ